MINKNDIIRSMSVIPLLWMALYCSKPESDQYQRRTKIILREIGNQLLLSNQDSTSLILPVKKINASTYRLSFQDSISFEPTELVSIVKHNLEIINFSPNYQVEVMQCADREVAYSYEISDKKKNTIIPCAGRDLPLACYVIEFRFLDLGKHTNKYDLIIIYVIIILAAVGLILYFMTRRKNISKNGDDFIKIGHFQFYQKQNKLIKEAIEISLSKKESELLVLLIAAPNQVISREELTKKVWEDNGVIVGRSLDTFISRLRKKLSADESLAIENVHGVGYKLVILSR